MLSFRGFLCQWFKRTFPKGWKSYGLVRGIVGVISFVLAAFGLVLYLTGHSLSPGLDLPAEIKPWLDLSVIVIPGLILLYLLCRGFVLAPYEIYKSAVITAETREQALTTEIEGLRTELTKATKEDQVRTDRKIARHALGNLLLTLQTRLEVVRMLNSFSYDDDVKREQEKTSIELVNTTYTFLEKFCDTAAASFISAKPEHLTGPESFERFQRQADSKRIHLNYLGAHISELKKTIERYPPLE